MNCYCISGLGADHRIFSRLHLPGVDLRPLPWLVPSPDESIGEYAVRMSAGIIGDRPVLMGVSFGGMMAIEIAKKIPGARVILVSSVQDHHQIPLWIKVGGRMYPRWLNPGMRAPRRSLRFVEHYFMGVESDDDRRLVIEFQNLVDRKFLHWAIHAIARWRNEWVPESIYHLHGDRDGMFPIGKVQPTRIIRGGTHLMVYNRAAAVSRALQELSWLAGD